MHLWKVQNKEEKKGFWLNVLGNCPNEAAKNPARHVLCMLPNHVWCAFC